MNDVTRILSQIESGDPTASDQLLPLVYDELRKFAAARLANERPGQTLQATALVHDAYIRLVDVEKVQHWDSRGHFFAAAAEAMRRILVTGASSAWGASGGLFAASVGARRGGSAQSGLEVGGEVSPAVGATSLASHVPSSWRRRG